MSQTVQRPPTGPEQEGFNGGGKPPLEPQKKPVFPNWGITAVATFVMVCLLLAGVVFSQQLGAIQRTSTTAASTTNSNNSSSSSNTSDSSSSSTTSNAPVAGPTMKHQLYNVQAPTALQGAR